MFLRCCALACCLEDIFVLRSIAWWVPPGLGGRLVPRCSTDRRKAIGNLVEVTTVEAQGLLLLLLLPCMPALSAQG